MMQDASNSSKEKKLECESILKTKAKQLAAV